MTLGERDSWIEFAFEITNSRSDKLQITLEPWGSVQDLAPGSKLEVRADGPHEGMLQIDLDEAGLTVWGWKRSRVGLFRDGEQVG